MRGCCCEGAGDDDPLAFASGEGVEGALRKLLCLRETHGIAGDALVALALDLEASEVRVPCPLRTSSIAVNPWVYGTICGTMASPRGDFLRGQGPQVGTVEVNAPALHAKHTGNGSKKKWTCPRR